MHATKGCMQQRDACNKGMQAPRRCMQQRDASTKQMHATRRCKHHGDTCNKEMQAQKMQAPKDVDIKEMHAQKNMRASKRCMRPKDARVDPHVRVQKMPASMQV